MILVIDVGNTFTVAGVYLGRKLIANWRMSTDKEKSADEIGMLLNSFFQYEKLNPFDVEGVIISSVVPTIMYSLEHAIKKYFRRNPLIVGPGIRTGLNIKCENPREVGADRIVNAVAGLALYGGPLIIVDFGTATTFCAITSKAEYLGNIICPGIKISSEALFQKTAKLPKIDLVKPDTVIGKNTVHSMQSGIIYGYIGMVEYIIRRMKAEMKEKDVKVIATGGMARLIAEETREIDRVDSLITLEGLRILYEKNSDMIDETHNK